MKCDHCTNFYHCNDITRKEESVYALVELLCQTKKITHREIFRTAYVWKFNKDIPYECLEQDVEDFKRTYNTPPYVTSYLTDMYGHE